MSRHDEQLFEEATRAFQRGDLALAERRLRALLRAFPDHPDVLHLQGVVLLAAKRPAEAVAPLRRAARAAESARPDVLAGILVALGSAERRAGEPMRAAETLERAVRLSPGDADIHFNLGNVFWDLGRTQDAAARFRTAAELSPRDAAIRFGLGEALARQGDGEGAEAAYAAVLDLDPTHAKALSALGALQLERHDITSARDSLNRALALAPDLAEAHVNLGLLRVQEGDADAAVAATMRAVRLKPSLAPAHSNLIQQMHYSARHGAAEILEEARRWNARHAAPLTSRAHANRDQVESPPTPPLSRKGGGGFLLKSPLPSREGVGGGGVPQDAWGDVHANLRDPERRLKVGYVGGDFRAHPVGYFSLSLFAHHDAAAVETFVYMTDPRPDALSEKIRAHVHHWRDAAGMGDPELAETIRADGIDILVDMAGHTAHNRLLAFAERPAPLQATGGGLGGTTGLATMDYILADRFEIPPGFERFHSEAVVRLPDGYVCYAPPDYAPEVASLPAREQGFVTFGCFNSAAKVTAEAIALWARVLAALPGAKLLLKNFTLGDPECRARFIRLLAEAGVSEDRLILEGPSPHAGLLAAYGRVDIALDPIPYSGGLTTLESLWMGVPVVALPGETFAARHSASHLANAGLPELVAASADDYVAIALGLASDLDALAGLRASLRPKIAASPVCDGAAYARGLEAAFRAMWRRWCQGEKPAALDIRQPRRQA